MKKITLLIILLFTGLFTFAQNATVVSYPTEFALDGTSYGPSVGQPALVIRYQNMAPSATAKVFAPVRATTQIKTDITGTITNLSGDLTGVAGAGNPGGSGFGSGAGLHNFVLGIDVTATNDRTLNFSTNVDGTFNVDIIFTRWSANNTSIVDGTEYNIVTRYFGTGADTVLPIKSDGAGGFEVAGMVYNSSAIAESHTDLLAAATTTLSNDQIKKDISSGVYPNPVTEGTVTINVKGADTYTILDIVGQVVLTQKATGTIDVSGLTSGIYILTTEVGTTKLIIE